MNTQAQRALYERYSDNIEQLKTESDPQQRASLVEKIYLARKKLEEDPNYRFRTNVEKNGFDLVEAAFDTSVFGLSSRAKFEYFKHLHNIPKNAALPDYFHERIQKEMRPLVGKLPAGEPQLQAAEALYEISESVYGKEFALSAILNAYGTESTPSTDASLADKVLHMSNKDGEHFLFEVRKNAIQRLFSAAKNTTTEPEEAIQLTMSSLQYGEMAHVEGLFHIASVLKEDPLLKREMLEHIVDAADKVQDIKIKSQALRFVLDHGVTEETYALRNQAIGMMFRLSRSWDSAARENGRSLLASTVSSASMGGKFRAAFNYVQSLIAPPETVPVSEKRWGRQGAEPKAGL